LEFGILDFIGICDLGFPVWPPDGRIGYLGEMDYSFSSELKDGYLHIRVRGDSDVPTTARYMEDMFRACKRRDCAYLLIEENLQGERLSMGDIFQLISEKIDELRLKIRVVAFVDASGQHSISNLEFAEDVIENRGITVRHFATVKDAAEWLRAQITSSHPPSGS